MSSFFNIRWLVFREARCKVVLGRLSTVGAMQGVSGPPHPISRQNRNCISVTCTILTVLTKVFEAR